MQASVSPWLTTSPMTNWMRNKLRRRWCNMRKPLSAGFTITVERSLPRLPVALQVILAARSRQCNKRNTRMKQKEWRKLYQG
jgi:hypothetical protein